MSLSLFPLSATLYFISIAAITGLVMGSFCHAWSWRIVHHESIARGRSRCPSCGHVLAARDLIPLISWMLLKGRCRYCRAVIPLRYPTAEFISMLLYISIFVHFGFTVNTFRFIMLSSVLFTAIMVDIDIMELPDSLLLLAALLSLLRLTEGIAVLPTMLIGAVSVSAPLLIAVTAAEQVLNKPAMGGGDIKLMAVLGLHLGAAETLLTLIIACGIGIMFATITMKDKDRAFAFGPAIALAAWIVVLAGEPIIAGYMSLF